MKRVIKSVTIYFLTTVFLVVFLLLGTLLIVEFGPSKTAKNLFVNSVMESSAGKFMATLFFSDAEIAKIQKQNSVDTIKDITNSNLIEIENFKDNNIEIKEINGSTYKGYLAIIDNPARVSVGISSDYFPSARGKTVQDIAKKYNAVLAINGGGFEDESGMGSGGTPIGIVISDSKIVYGTESNKYEMIGFDKDNKLVVGTMTGKDALNRGMRDALSFGPILIVNGNVAKINGAGSGLNPRTAIGQRKDGKVLLLVIDGRQANSLGASYQDIVNIMLEYGAINAANLDGGSSSQMYYEGKYINNCSSLYGPRRMPTSFIVKWDWENEQEVLENI